MNSHKYLTYSWRYKKEDLKFCPRCGSLFSLEDIHIPSQPQLVCDKCHFIFYLDPKLVVCCLVVFEGKILLLRRNEEPRSGLWALPGGHVERGADIFMSAEREVKEEAGLEVMLGPVIKLFSLPDSGIVQITFQAQAINEEITTNIESIEGRWFSKSEIPWPDLAFESTKAAILAYYESSAA